MDAEQEARVWARVRGGRVLPLGDCARCAGIYRWLYKRGICRETAAGLLKQQTEQLEILRGLLALNGQPEPDWVMADPVGMTEVQAAAKGVELCRALVTELHNLGKVEAIDYDGQGTLLTVKMPVSDAESFQKYVR